jgi:hypothetical protein
MLISDILGDNDDPTTQFEGIQDSVPSLPHSNSIHHNSSVDLEVTDGSKLFGARGSDDAVAGDITMDNQLSLLIKSEPNINQVCSKLQSK